MKKHVETTQAAAIKRMDMLIWRIQERHKKNAIISLIPTPEKRRWHFEKYNAYQVISAHSMIILILFRSCAALDKTE